MMFCYRILIFWLYCALMMQDTWALYTKSYQQSGKKCKKVYKCGIFFYIFTKFSKELEFMHSYIGDYNCKADAKGRILFPSAFLRQMTASTNERFVVKKDLFEKCLVLYPIEEWERQNKIIRSKINPYNKEHNRFIRGFYKGTAEIVLDGNNRMLIPKRLLDLVEITKEVVLAGQDGKIEIWAKKLYEKFLDVDDEFAQLTEKIMDGSTNEINE